MKPKIFTFSWEERIITIAIKSLGKIRHLISEECPFPIIVGWSIMRPGDESSDLGKVIATGRLEKNEQKKQGIAITSIRPSVATLEHIAKDYAHYMMNNPNDFFIDTLQRKAEKTIEKELDVKVTQASIELLQESK